jgi:polyhydroxyalkanoate synthase subunit PhaE
MSNDPWRAWQTWAALFTPPAAERQAPGMTSMFASAERFQAAAGKYSQAAALGPASAATAAQSFADFLRDEFAGFFASGLFTPPATPAGIPGFAAAASIPNPGDVPSLGLAREHLERARRAGEAWQRLDEAQRRLQRLWLDALREASAAFARRLDAAPVPMTDPTAPQRLYDTWIDCAEDAYAQAAHGEAFSDALADYVNAGSEYRRETQTGAEAWAKLWDLPTRSEINSLAERLRAVEEALRTRDASPPSGTPRAPRAPRASRAGRRKGTS